MVNNPPGTESAAAYLPDLGLLRVAVFLLILAFSSDYAKIRFPFIALGFLLTFIGFIIYATIDVQEQLHVAYFATFMMCWGTSAPSVLLSTWYNNNIAHEGRRIGAAVLPRGRLRPAHRRQREAGVGAHRRTVVRHGLRRPRARPRTLGQGWATA